MLLDSARLKQESVSNFYINIVNSYHFPSCISKTSVPTITLTKFLSNFHQPWLKNMLQALHQTCFFLPFHFSLYTIPLIRNIPYSIKQALKRPIKSGVATIETVSYYFSPFRKTSFFFPLEKKTLVEVPGTDVGVVR